MTTCRQWSTPTGRYFQPLCINALWPESGNPSLSCAVCIKPKAVAASDCGECPETPAKTYRVTINGTQPSNYNPTPNPYLKEHILHQVSDCVWETKEMELGVWEEPFVFPLQVYIVPVTYFNSIATTPAFPSEPMVRLTALTASGTPLKSRWQVIVYWRTIFFDGSPNPTFHNKRSWIYNGTSKRHDCYYPASGTFTSETSFPVPLGSFPLRAYAGPTSFSVKPL